MLNKTNVKLLHGGAYNVSFTTNATTVESLYVADTTQRYSLVSAFSDLAKGNTAVSPGRDFEPRVRSSGMRHRQFSRPAQRVGHG